MSEPAFIFVYGSLRPGSGHPMSQWLAGNGHWLGRGEVAGRLFRVSWYPALVSGEGRVIGDVYRLEASLFPELDAFEEVHGQPDDEYERVHVSVLMEAGGLVIAQTYWYRLPVTALECLESGDWLQALAASSPA